MLKPTVKRGLMLDFIPNKLSIEKEVNSNRIYKLNSYDLCGGDIIYLASRELRLEYNWAVVYGQDLARKENRKFKIIVIKSYINYSELQKPFLEKGLEQFKLNADDNNIDFELLESLPQNIGALVIDFNPIRSYNKSLNNLDFPIYEIDSHNIIPARFISQKQEFSAATLRRKVYANIAEFLTIFPNKFNIKDRFASAELDLFLNNSLDCYSELKNDPNVNATSNMSKYLHFGFISAQKIAQDVINSKASRDNIECYLEELIVRKELSDNFCLYNPNYNNINSALPWAINSLNAHRGDIRNYIYSKSEFEKGMTHDNLWNKIQMDLVSDARIHGFLRMYWAKKILEWSESPEVAIDIAIYLNDKYALDGNDPNGYVGILWSIVGLHDRAFTNRLVTGKIRYMSFNGCKKKFDVDKYIRIKGELFEKM